MRTFPLHPVSSNSGTLPDHRLPCLNSASIVQVYLFFKLATLPQPQRPVVSPDAQAVEVPSPSSPELDSLTAAQRQALYDAVVQEMIRVCLPFLPDSMLSAWPQAPQMGDWKRGLGSGVAVLQATIEAQVLTLAGLAGTLVRQLPTALHKGATTSSTLYPWHLTFSEYAGCRMPGEMHLPTPMGLKESMPAGCGPCLAPNTTALRLWPTGLPPLRGPSLWRRAGGPTCRVRACCWLAPPNLSTRIACQWSAYLCLAAGVPRLLQDVARCIRQFLLALCCI